MAPATLTLMVAVTAVWMVATVSHSGLADVTWHCGGLKLTPAVGESKWMLASMPVVIPELETSWARIGIWNGGVPAAKYGRVSAGFVTKRLPSNTPITP